MKENLSYSEAYARLQEITQAIENADLEVDELSALLTEAGSLLKWCRQKLFQTDAAVKEVLDGLLEE